MQEGGGAAASEGAEHGIERGVLGELHGRKADFATVLQVELGAEGEAEQLHAETDAEHGHIGFDRLGEQAAFGGQARVTDVERADSEARGEFSTFTVERSS